jgi:hypothetical protein
MDANMNTNICETCRESKTLEGARFEHVRLGLDEPPEPIICKCKRQDEYIKAIMDRIREASSITTINTGMRMNSLPSANINALEIVSVDMRPNLEVEARLNAIMSESMYELMRSGMFGTTTISTIEEVGCSWWVGPPINMNSKVRIRSNGEKTVKVPMDVYQLSPGVKIAISHEYKFVGTIMRPDYVVNMDEVKTSYEFEGMRMNLIARKYIVEDSSSYSAEVEFESRLTDMKLRRVLDWLVNIIGSVRMIANEIDHEYMNSARSVDHAVVDVSDMSVYKGVFMYKADGMKVYVFCYSFGYVVTMTDNNLTVLTYRFTNSMQPLYEMTSTPDIMVAEMMMDGSLVYIDTLAMNGAVVPSSRPYQDRPVSKYQYPEMTVRKRWDSMPPVNSRMYTSMPNDGIVCVTPFRTLRLKEPTIDLRYVDGNLCTVDAGNVIPIARGSEKMTQYMIYEMKMYRSINENEVVLRYPIARLSKARPNNMDIVKRAVASVSKNAHVTTSLFDITSMSFSMRSRVYEMAQASASSTRKVIVIFGCGRLQEWKQMQLSNFSYIAIDPEIEIERFSRNMRRVTVLPYDVKSKFSTNIISISKKPGNVLYCKTTSEDFIMRTGATQFMSTNGIPAVFSFSISYHIALINTLVRSGIKCYGCGFVHDGMDINPVGSPPVTMVRRRSSNSNEQVVATFGKSTYVEPFLSFRSVPGLKLVKDALKDVWQNVDPTTIEIMNRAVIMSSSRT